MAEDATSVEVIRLGVDDATFALNLAMVTPVQAAALRFESAERWRWPVLLRFAYEAIGPEELAGLLFVALLQANVTPHATYAQVCVMLADAGPVTVEFLTVAEIEAETASAE